jgi:hypothetical protein
VAEKSAYHQPMRIGTHEIAAGMYWHGAFRYTPGMLIERHCRSARMDQKRRAICFDVNLDCKVVKQDRMFQVALY